MYCPRMQSALRLILGALLRRNILLGDFRLEFARKTIVLIPISILCICLCNSMRFRNWKRRK